MSEEPTKICQGCKTAKPLSLFSVRRASTDGRQERCKACNAAYAKQRYANNKDDFKELRRWQHLKYRFGLSQEQYKDLLAAQDGRCAICRTTEPGGRGNVFMVDHDHSCCAGYSTCGKCIRGLLCNDCNVGLARFRDNPYLLNVAADYVKESKRATGHRFAVEVLGLKPIREA